MPGIECRVGFRLVIAASCLAVAGPARPVDAAPISVETAPKFFNPSVGQRVAIRLKATESVPLAVEVVDRDGVRIRSLGEIVVAEEAAIEWDGRDDAGAAVPDEAYYPRVRRADTGQALYDPVTNHEPSSKRIASTSYSKQTGVLSYFLDEPSRVHVQAGQARAVAGREMAEGPVLHTIVDRAPRAAGRVVETWSGWDESREIYVPDLPHFAIGILATSLPENSMIAIGNRSLSFPEYVARRGGPPLRDLPMEPSAHHQHRDLNAMEDRSPRLSLRPADGGGDSTWSVPAGEDLTLTVDLETETSTPFLTKGNRLHVFLGIDHVLEQSCAADPCEARVPASLLRSGRARLAVNWASGVGPVAVASHWVEIQ